MGARGRGVAALEKKLRGGKVACNASKAVSPWLWTQQAWRSPTAHSMDGLGGARRDHRLMAAL
eukprot:CAMPEP_0168407678 /NCGR_PEP_ID=MMETSP0228-20121227/26285_1 /TAXON_ID=133427 /ORGANISM="Protoceratium reticulatum, Strain CCCM 535 (=CCMP 1889)" /LENGTH=62 /DNA_ID=CAMNT_0008421353 /DNA_START=93 /DNA_END=278 /DNA_ORIENTATION=-